MALPGTPARHPTVALHGMAATSQPSATLAALDVLREGGSAADAAVCAAAILSVTEPYSTGPGGDLFALVHHGGRLHGLDAAGPAPRTATVAPPDTYGPRSVTVPGGVAGWSALRERFGRLDLERLLAPAIALAEDGFGVGVNCARAWAAAPHLPARFGPAPRAGERVRLPDLGRTLRELAAHGPGLFYTGRVGAAITADSWLEDEDLATYAPRWVEPLVCSYAGLEVAEMPAPTQGVAVLEALSLLDRDGSGLVAQVQAVGLALEDAFATIADGTEVAHLFAPDHVERRRGQRPAALREAGGGTVYLCVVDADGTAVSLVQSLFDSFGSGVVAGDTGVVLQNRGACFGVGGGQVRPGERPFHTIIPGMLCRDGELVGPFGVMGGYIQAQAHTRLVVGLAENGLDPQAALDLPRFRIDGAAIALEEGLWDRAAEVEALGYEVRRDPGRELFGGGQAIVRGADGALFGGSDPRKDGLALGY
jgi:gamma-glutamyltranspeptidase / glutathione hydrolase